MNSIESLRKQIKRFDEMEKDFSQRLADLRDMKKACEDGIAALQLMDGGASGVIRKNTGSKEFGDFVRARRERLKIPSATLGRLLGYASSSSISSIEAGEQLLSSGRMIKLATILDVPLAQLQELAGKKEDANEAIRD